MDLSALIFVALAVAWAVYLIPKALKHHDEAQRRRSVDRFSSTMRVLARRDGGDDRSARLVLSPGRATQTTTVTRKPQAAPTRAQVRARREAARRAAKRRLRVVLLVLAGNAAVATLAALAIIGWVWCAVPAAVLVAWLVACRLMVKKERATDRVARSGREVEVSAELEVEVALDEGPATEELEAVPAAAAEERAPGSWDPVPVTLPTYVDKATAGRTVRTIDLDSTGVWSSGRSETDSQLVRDADAARAEASAEAAETERRRASGS